MYEALESGVIMCKLLLMINPRCIDVKKVKPYVKNMKGTDMFDNLAIAVKAAKNLGI